MQEQKQELLSRLKEANNVLVTVSNNPSVDQLASVIGLTLTLNKMKKHATAVYSGKTPSTIEFLEPEKTIKQNTDSLRDFIISLDRNKADKLRYKVEDKLVRIYISPYHSAIGQDDLIFSQGDFNIDIVVALGVNEQKDLDQAITAHGRILHDATVATVTTGEVGTVGSIHWVDTNASSLSEMISGLIQDMQSDVLDNQIATALLTGIVAETDRFSNEKTRPSTMAISSSLMAAGANQQLVSEKLAPPPPPPPETKPDLPPPVVEGERSSSQLGSSDDDAESQQVSVPAGPAGPPEDTAAGAQDKEDGDGVLRISHEEASTTSDDEELDENGQAIHIDEHGNLYDGKYAQQQTTSTEGAPPSTLNNASSNNDSGSEHPSIITKPSSTMVTEPPKYQRDGGESMGATSSDARKEDKLFDPLADNSPHRNERIIPRNDSEPEENNQEPSTEVPSQNQPEQRASISNASTQKDSSAEQIVDENVSLGSDRPQTLADIETSVGAHQNNSYPDSNQQSGYGHQAEANSSTSAPPDLDDARRAIIEAANEPVPQQEAPSDQQVAQPSPTDSEPQPNQPQQTEQSPAPSQQPAQQQSQSPPPVPPPMMPPQ